MHCVQCRSKAKLCKLATFSLFYSNIALFLFMMLQKRKQIFLTNHNENHFHFITFHRNETSNKGLFVYSYRIWENESVGTPGSLTCHCLSTRGGAHF